MSWGSFLLVGDMGQQLDLAEQAEELGRLRRSLARRRCKDSDQDTQIDALARENLNLKLGLAALVRLLAVRGVVRPEEITDLVSVLNRSDAPTAAAMDVPASARADEEPDDTPAPPSPPLLRLVGCGEPGLLRARARGLRRGSNPLRVSKVPNVWQKRAAVRKLPAAMADDPIHVADPALRPIAEKVLAGDPLSHADGVALYASRDLHGVGRLANVVRERLHGDRTYYNRNRHINYTNVCALSCKFCSFYRKRGEEGAYEMPVEQVVATARKAYDGGATEVHVVGGLHPWLKFDYYLDLLRGITRECPGLHVKAFTAIEIVHLSRVARMSVREVLTALRDAGLGSLPGGGAEIFDDRVHDEVFKGKVRADRWFDVHRAAHALGIYSNATMLYGHVETVEERVGHLIKLRELQAESLGNCRLPIADCQMEEKGVAGVSLFGNRPSQIGNPSAFFNCVIPLSFIPEHSELGHLPGPTGLTDLKTLAITRLMVHNIAHIKAFWIMQGIGLSQVALNWGCDDLDGTVVWYDITKREGERGTTHQELHEADIRRLIREARRKPVERDTLYNEVRRAARTDRPERAGAAATAAAAGEYAVV